MTRQASGSISNNDTGAEVAAHNGDAKKFSELNEIKITLNIDVTNPVVAMDQVRGSPDDATRATH